MNADFRRAMDSIPEGALKKAPPPPPKKAPPPPPKKEVVVDREPGVPERGFINSPEAPLVAPRNPEEAAAQQGVQKPQPPAPDDLDGLSREQLKEIGLQTSAFPANTKMRDPALRDAIRIARKNVRSDGSYPQHSKSGQEAKPVDYKDTDDATGDISALISEAAAIHSIIERAKSSPEPKTEAEEIFMDTSPTKPYTPATYPFILLVNCDLQFGSGDGNLVHQSYIVREAEVRLGVPDFRLIDYGKGPGELACAVRAMVEEGMFNVPNTFISIDTDTSAGSALVDVLFSKAAFVIRGH